MNYQLDCVNLFVYIGVEKVRPDPAVMSRDNSLEGGMMKSAVLVALVSLGLVGTTEACGRGGFFGGGFFGGGGGCRSGPVFHGNCCQPVPICGPQWAPQQFPVQQGFYTQQTFPPFNQPSYFPPQISLPQTFPGQVVPNLKEENQDNQKVTPNPENSENIPEGKGKKSSDRKRSEPLRVDPTSADPLLSPYPVPAEPIPGYFDYFPPIQRRPVAFMQYAQ